MGSRRILDSIIGRKMSADDEMTWEGDWDDLFMGSDLSANLEDDKEAALAGLSLKEQATPESDRLKGGATKRQLFDASPSQLKAPPRNLSGLQPPSLSFQDRSASPMSSMQDMQKQGYMSPTSRKSIDDLHNQGYSSPNNLRSSPHNDLMLASSPRRSASLHTPLRKPQAVSPGGSVYMRGKSPSVISRTSSRTSTHSVENLEDLMKTVNVDDCDEMENDSAAERKTNGVQPPPRTPEPNSVKSPASSDTSPCTPVSVYMRGPVKSPQHNTQQHQPQLELQQALVDNEIEYV